MPLLLRAQRFFCLLSLFLSAPVLFAANSWTPLGLSGGVVFSVAIDPATPSTLFAATLAGGFRSVDGGANWSKVFHLECAAFAVHPANSSIVFLVNRSREVYKSTDGGLTFALSNAGITAAIQGSIFGRFAFQPGNPEVMYYAWQSGLFKSTDGGSNWVASDSGAVNAQSVLDLAVDSADPQVVYLVLRSKGVYKSPDAGATWNAASTGLPFSGPTISLSAFAQDPSTPQNLFAISGDDDRLYASTNGGTAWTARSANSLEGMSSLRVAPGDGLTLYSGGRDIVGVSATYKRFVFKSTDGGVNFANTSASSGAAFSSAAPLAIPAASPLTVYANLGDGLSKTVDGGTNWTPINIGLRADEPGYPIGFSPTAPSTWYVGYAQGGIHITADGGTNMSRASGSLVEGSIGAIVVDPTNPLILLAGGATKASLTDNQYVVYMVRSTNGGASWNPVNNPTFPTGTTALQPWGFVAVPTGPTTFFALAASEGVYKSTDGGLNFVAANTGLPVTFTLYQSIAAADNSGTTLYAATSSQGLFKTTNGATSWTAVGAGLPSLNIREVLVSPAVPQRVFVISGTALYRSDDAGGTWNPIGASFPSSVLALAMDPVSPATIYATGSITGAASRTIWFYRSTDAGQTWQAVTSEGIDAIAVFRLTVDRENTNRLLVGGRGGISRLTLEVSDCTELISPITANYSSAGSGGSVSVTAPVGCAWAASAPAGSFVSITAGTTGSGDGTVDYTVEQNATGNARTTTLTIAGRSFEVTQSAAGVATFALTATASPAQVASSWSAVAGATMYEVRRSSGGGSFNLVTSVAALVHADTTISAGSGYLYRIHALDSGGNVLAYSNADLAVPFVYTDASIVAAATAVKAQHFLDLRLAANAARAAAGLSASTFTGTIVSGNSILRTHLVEIRTAIDSARAAIGLTPLTYVDGTITAGSTTVKAAHVNDLRNGVQ
ncbi:MAG: hypothetical protein M3P06_17555 [Acidobacteriota bacterium]|nr:hypothetical protein [Acidobacteriota bacterium]